MSNKPHQTGIESEFALERMVLFSDAVFAIAITLLVIDIKWPEIFANGHHARDEAPAETTWKLLRPMFLEFMAFAFSFFSIGRSWYIHLKIFRYVRDYDQGLVVRNLLFLFFIVMFPFSASGISGYVSDGFLFPVYVYVTNLTLLSFFHWILCYYIFYQRPKLAHPGEDDLKRYVYTKSKYSALVQVVISLVISTAIYFFSNNPKGLLLSMLPIPLLAAFVKRRINKFKPRPHRI